VKSTVATDQMAVLLIASAELPEQVPCRVAALDDVGASITFAAPTALKRGTRAMLVVGPEGDRQLASTVCTETSEAGAHLRLVSPWHPFAIRAAHRYKADIEARVRSPAHPRALAGRVLDISTAGAAVRVAGSFDGRFVELSLGADMFETWLPCTLVEGNADKDGHTLRLAFSDSGSKQMALVRQVLAALAADREAGGPSGAAAPTPGPAASLPGAIPAIPDVPDVPAPASEAVGAEPGTGNPAPRRKRKRGTWGAAAKRGPEKVAEDS